MIRLGGGVATIRGVEPDAGYRRIIIIIHIRVWHISPRDELCFRLRNVTAGLSL